MPNPDPTTLGRIRERDRTDLARRDGSPATVAVYLQGHPAMRGSLLAVLRVLDVTLVAEADALPSFPWESLRYEHVETIRARLVAKYEPATARRHLAAVRGVLRTAWKLGRLDRETFERAIDVDPVRGDSAPAGRMLAPAEASRLLGACQTPRNVALVSLALHAGLRREEIADLDLEDVQPDRVVVCKGKGSKRREVLLAPSVRATLERWIEARDREPGPLFTRAWRGGAVLLIRRRLTPGGVWAIIVGIAKAVGLHVTPHDFRRTFASTLLDRGVDLLTVQTLLGHADPKTTKKYDRRGDERKRRAAEELAAAFKEG